MFKRTDLVYIVTYLLKKGISASDILDNVTMYRSDFYDFDWNTFLAKHPEVFWSKDCPMFKDGKCLQHDTDYCLKEVRNYKIGFYRPPLKCAIN